MSDGEKLVEAGIKYQDGPLVFRSQVGGDVYHRQPGGRYCWPRNFILRLTLICIIFAAVTGCILILFGLYQTRLWPWNRYISGSCRALTPFPGFDVEERFSYEPNAIVVTHGPIAGFPAVTVFHLISEDTSVMRTDGSCYIYPLAPEVSNSFAIDSSLFDRIKEAEGIPQFKSPFGMRVLAVAPNDDGSERVHINHPMAAANCSNVPNFRLIEIVVSQAAGQDPTDFDEGTEAESVTPSNVCSKECPLGESRDSLGIPRQVCRCPPKAPLPAMGGDTRGDIDFQVMPTPYVHGPEDFAPYSVEMLPAEREDLATKAEGAPVPPPPVLPQPFGDDIEVLRDEEDLEEDEEEAEEEAEMKLRSVVEASNAWISEDASESLSRSRRAAEVLNNLETPMQIPGNCQVVDKILEGAIPSGKQHTLPLMVIVKC